MPRKPDLPCAKCGELMWRGSTSAPVGLATCRPCRRATPKPPRKPWVSDQRCSMDGCPNLTQGRGLCSNHYSQWYRRNRNPRPRKGMVCAECGKAVQSNAGGAADGLILCKKHRKVVADSRRRARKVGAYVADVNRHKVFASDGYRCHICKLKTDPTKQAPHPQAPTIDHVIPLSKGGTHEPSNCRTAHLLCNMVKGCRGGGEQFAMAF